MPAMLNALQLITERIYEMKIEVGRKYKRVRISANHGWGGSATFIGQVITVRKFDGEDVWFSKTTKSGYTDDHCVQDINRFKLNFKPISVSLENK